MFFKIPCRKLQKRFFSRLFYLFLLISTCKLLITYNKDFKSTLSRSKVDISNWSNGKLLITRQQETNHQVGTNLPGTHRMWTRSPFGYPRHSMYPIYGYIDPQTTPTDRHMVYMDCSGIGQTVKPSPVRLSNLVSWVWSTHRLRRVPIGRACSACRTWRGITTEFCNPAWRWMIQSCQR